MCIACWLAGWMDGWMDEYVCVYNVAIMPYLASGGGKERKKDGRTDGMKGAEQGLTSE